MKNKKDKLDENEDDTKEFVVSNLGKEADVKASDKDAHFEISDEAKKNMFENTGKRKETEEIKEGAPEMGDVDSDQDALFEVSEAAQGSACDDGIQGASPEKKEIPFENKKIEELSGQLNAANDKYLRLMAEFDNFKRRSYKEYERMVDVANEKLMKDFIEVRENFERAFKSNTDGKQFFEGIKLIFAKLNTILQKHGLETYGEINQKFDPQIHDALMRMPHETVEEGHVVEVHERGYKLKGNIIKHAKVVVSSGKPPKKEIENETVIEIK
jgi:molecular chaperone GrpE